MARIELSNIGGGGTTLSLTTTGTSGAATLAGSVLNIPIYQGQLTLTTTGTSGAATLSGDILNIPQYSGGGGTPAGSAGQVQFNSTPAGSFAASANLAWDNTNVRLNVGAPSSPTGKLNIKGSGTLTTVNTRLTNSGDTELFKVLDNGNTNIGTGFNWDNTNGRLGIGVASPTERLQVNSGNVLVSDNITGTNYITLSNSSTTGSSSFRLLSSGSSQAQIFKYGTSFTPYKAIGSGDMGHYNAVAGDITMLNDFSSGRIKFSAGAASSSQLTLFANGNLGVGVGTTDGGYRLDVISTSASHGVRFRAPNANSGTDALLVQNTTVSDLYKIEANGKISYLATNTAAGTTGAQTINRPSGTVNFAIGASALVVTNSLCSANSIVFATVRTNDATAYIKNVVPAAGSFTINLGAAATAETSVGFFIIN